jgi:hypothetical protein
VKGVGFTSIRLPQRGWVAQLVEQRIENPRVAGSIPAPATTSHRLYINGLVPWAVPVDTKKTRYRLIQRGNRRKAFYCVDSVSGKRSSLGTSDRDAAQQLVLAKNQALRQPSFNLQIARAYLAGSDSGVMEQFNIAI